jgi:hypothetical protein
VGVAELDLRVYLKMAPHVLPHSCATNLLKGRADIRHVDRPPHAVALEWLRAGRAGRLRFREESNGGTIRS